MFRVKRSIPEVSYDDQGYIYFYSRRYNRLPERDRRRIERLCREAGGEHHKALLEFVTTAAGAVAVCTKHYLSQSTLERCVRKYYLLFEKIL